MMQQFPGGTEISTPYHDDYEIAYVLNRKTFDNEVLNFALKEGPEYMNKTRATGLIREDGEIKGVKAKIDEKEDVEIRSNIIIGTDGVESHIGRWAGIYKSGLDSYETAVILDWLFDDVDVDEEMGHTHLHTTSFRLINLKLSLIPLCFPLTQYSFYPTLQIQYSQIHDLTYFQSQTHILADSSTTNKPITLPTRL
ncbi:MAG: Digeranylgeranylglycerophospholipid reductase [Candidatus Methanolliviera sp. GoM_asphalt]|nr:MAG: Digeranylgeranylglycerophospholipid reductase [Candidatus Methanolliviera sp. GoM_asphalt]